MSNCPIELAEWISDRELLDLIRQSGYQVVLTHKGVDLYISVTEEHLQKILQHSNSFSELKDCFDEIFFQVEGEYTCSAFHPCMLAEFQTEQAEYDANLQEISQVAEILKDFETPAVMLCFSTGVVLAANQPFADLFDTTVKALSKINLLYIWRQGLEQLLESLHKYNKARQLPCRVRLGAQLTPTWVLINALLLDEKFGSICLIEITRKF